MIRLHRGFDQLAAVGGEQGGEVGFPQALPPLQDGYFPQGVEVPPAGGHEINLSAEKEIQFSRKRAFRPQRTFGHGFDEPMLGGEPVDDEAGVRQSGEAGDDGGHPGKSMEGVLGASKGEARKKRGQFSKKWISIENESQ